MAPARQGNETVRYMSKASVVTTIVFAFKNNFNHYKSRNYLYKTLYVILIMFSTIFICRYRYLHKIYTYIVEMYGHNVRTTTLNWIILFMCLLSVQGLHKRKSKRKERLIPKKWRHLVLGP